MARNSFLPATPAFLLDPIGDDADENEDHSQEHDEVREVLGDRERPDARLADVGQVVLDDVEENSEGDDEGAELRGAGDRRPGWAGRRREWR
jgi:hypothetical protein